MLYSAHSISIYILMIKVKGIYQHRQMLSVNCQLSPMARTCERCDKGSKKAASRSHSKIKTLRRQHANVQKVHGEYLCTSCIRTMSKHTA